MNHFISDWLTDLSTNNRPFFIRPETSYIVRSMVKGQKDEKDPIWPQAIVKMLVFVIFVILNNSEEKCLAIHLKVCVEMYRNLHDTKKQLKFNV